MIVVSHFQQHVYKDVIIIIFFFTNYYSIDVTKNFLYDLPHILLQKLLHPFEALLFSEILSFNNGYFRPV